MNVILIWSESSLVHSDPILQTKEWLIFFGIITFNRLILRLSKFYGIDYNNLNVTQI